MAPAKKSTAKKAVPKATATKPTAAGRSARTATTTKGASTKAASTKRAATKKATTTTTSKSAAPKAKASASTASASKSSTSRASGRTAAPKTPAATKASSPRAAKAPASRPAASTTPAPGPKAAARKAPARKAAPKAAFDAKFLAEQRALLLEERATYTRQAANLQAEADSLAELREPGDVQFDEESGEGDTLAVERERDLALSARALEQIDEIDHALAKLDAGTYGICEVSGEPIPKARLQAIPQARERVEYKVGGFHRH